MSLLVDSRYLPSAGRVVAFPFRVKLTCHGRACELYCTEMLRVFPGKRLVCFGQWCGDQMVAKFFLDPEGGKRHCTGEKRGVTALIAAGIRPSKVDVFAFHDILPRPALPEIQVNRCWRKVQEKYEAEELIGSEGSGGKIGIGLVRGGKTRLRE